ncbi:DotA/TraY family protein [Aminobacter sp. AP02]|uniref:DotA/TraY family protein n=1 Tax=Aminobacter sp. AP02 TaxID=2135737 RepID=UPI000D6BFB4D|nr:DotA/TraY family protein [Aminobacter sp. AP02]PWK64636.1 conjugal transfer/type IV secretion protein DotA/TraY [Aminobacter sp. AP02]
MAFDLFATPSEHNILWAWLNALLPSDTSSPWGFAMSVFSNTLLYIGTFFVGLHLLTALVSSAYSGKVLGDKFHQIHAPLRIVFGIGLMIPIAASFSSSHHLLRDVVGRAAINLVDANWVAYVDYAAGKEVKIAPLSPGGSMLVMDVLESEICAAIHNNMTQPWGLKGARIPPVAGERKGDVSGWWNPVTTNARTEWSYGPDCGRIALPVLPDKPGFTSDREAAVAKIVTSVRAGAAQFGEVFRVQSEPLSADAAMTAIRDGRLPQLSEAVRGLGKEYDSAIATATAKEMALDEDGAERRQRLIDAARQQGAATAGMYWMHISSRSQQVSALTGAKHERTGIRLGDAGSAGKKNLEAALATLRNLVAGEEAEIRLTANDFAAGGDQDSSILTRILSPIWRDLGEWAMSKGDPNESTVQRMLRSDPIGDQISSGHAFMSIAEVGIVAAFVPIALAFSGVGIATGAWGAALWAMGWATPILGSLWVIGAVRAYVLPVLPFIYVWVFMGLWLLAVLEAAISLVVWAFGFIRLDGEDFLAHQSKMGAMLLFQVFLMPVLGLLAFEAAFVLLPLIVGGLEIVWATAFFGQTGGQLIGPSALLVGYVLITFLTLYLVMHIFGQIFHVPDRVMAWFGAPSHGFSDKSLFVAMAGGLAGTLGRGMPGLPSVPRPNANGGDSRGQGKASIGGVTARKK